MKKKIKTQIITNLPLNINGRFVDIRVSFRGKIRKIAFPNRTILEQLYGRPGEDLGIENLYIRPYNSTCAIP